MYHQTLPLHFKTKTDLSYSEKLIASLTLVRDIFLGLLYSPVRERKRARGGDYVIGLG